MNRSASVVVDATVSAADAGPVSSSSSVRVSVQNVSPSPSASNSTLFAAWNAAIYVAQIEDERLSDVVSSGAYLDATKEILQKHGGLWFWDESYIISRKRDSV